MFMFKLFIFCVNRGAKEEIELGLPMNQIVSVSLQLIKQIVWYK